MTSVLVVTETFREDCQPTDYMKIKHESSRSICGRYEELRSIWHRLSSIAVLTEIISQITEVPVNIGKGQSTGSRHSEVRLALIL